MLRLTIRGLLSKMEVKIGTIDSIKSEGDGRTITGYANVKNIIDKGGDVVVDGAYADLEATLKEGFVCRNHDWGNPVGHFTELKEDDYGLYFEAHIYDTEEGNDLLKVIKERVAAEKTVGLSIGFFAKGYEFGEFQGRRVRFLKEVAVKEVTVTMVPMNGESTVLGTKSRQDNFLELKSVLESYLDRLMDIKSLGRTEDWCKERAAELKSLIDLLDEAVESINSEQIESQDSESQDVSDETDQETDQGSVELAKAKALAELELL